MMMQVQVQVRAAALSVRCARVCTQPSTLLRSYSMGIATSADDSVTVTVDRDRWVKSDRSQVEFKVVTSGAGSLLQISLPAKTHTVAAGGRIIALSGQMTTSSSLNGLLGLVGRTLSGENFMMQRITAGAKQGTALIAPQEMGDIACVKLDGTRQYQIRKGAFVASSPGVRLHGVRTAPEHRRDMGFFTLGASGSGVLALTTHGGMFRVDMEEGDAYTVNRSNVVAWETSMKPRAVAGTGSANASGSVLSWIWSAVKRPFQAGETRTSTSSQAQAPSTCRPSSARPRPHHKAFSVGF